MGALSVCAGNGSNDAVCEIGAIKKSIDAGRVISAQARVVSDTRELA